MELRNVTFGPQTLSQANSVTLTGAPVLTVTAPVTISDPITGGALVMAGTSVMTLTGTNSYTDGTEVTGGTLDIADAAALPTTGIVNVGRPGTVNLLGLLGSYLPVPGVEPGDDTAVEPTSSLASVTVAGGVPEMRPGMVEGSGGVGTVGAGTEGTPAVPEPSTFVLLAAGAIGLIGWAWRRQRQRR
jgi:hypothetical protein